LTKAVKPKLETALSMSVIGEAGIFFIEERNPLLFRTKRVEGHSYWTTLGKRRGKFRIGGNESFQAQCRRDYWSPLLPKYIAWGSTDHWKWGVTSTLGPQNYELSVRDLIACLLHTWLEGSKTQQPLELRAGQEVPSLVFGWHGGVP
jgi:hypothetical protein